MAIKGYVLIKTALGMAGTVAEGVSEIDGVSSVENITGQYDAIAVVESENMDVMGKIVVEKIQNIAGIIETITCPTVSLK